MRSLVVALAACLLALPAWSQGNPTGTISGRVADAQGLPLPGANVSVESPNLQGKRTTVTSANGDYIFALLPPGAYTVTFDLAGFRTVKQTVRVGAAESIPVGATLDVATVTEEITVTAPSEPFQQTAPVTTNFKSELIATLPLDRGLNATVLLAPGVQSTGPSGGVTINGAMSFENLFLINGVVVNENVRGQALGLFIEDAIQETTISRSSVSAEFGRFSGGVVNAITKSGTNRFEGSFRTTFNNDDWRELTSFPNDTKLDKVVPAYEATLGGPLLKDRIWFFGAGRLEKNSEARQTRITNLPYEITDDEKRYEGKLTFSLNPSNVLRVSYINIQRDQLNNSFGNIMDKASLYDRQTPQDLLSVNYTTTVSSNFALEAQYSQRRFTFRGSGSRFTDLIQGTLLIDQQRGGTRFWSPTFCGVCDDEKRDNQNFLLKGSYFLSTADMGAHNIVFGVDSFNDKRFANNHQSGSDYRVFATTSVIQGENLFPVFDQSTYIRWTPIFEGSQGTNFRSHALFVNDTWRYNAHLTFNLGLRYDRNDGKDGNGTKTVKDSNISPRLAMTFDPTGNGVWTINGSYGKYVAAIAGGFGDSQSTGGQPATIDFDYRGPVVNTSGPYVPTDQALRTLFGWFQATGGTNRATRGAPILPGVNTRVGDGLRSPNVQELSLGISRRLGNRGLIRVDAVHRRFHDFYANHADTSTGKVTDERLSQFGLVPTGRSFDLRFTENTDKATREHRALETQLNYRVAQSLEIGGNYTLSETKGNFVGETGTGGPAAAAFDFYPEYRDPAWNAPEGFLPNDSRHKLRVWANWNLPLPQAIGRFTFSVLERFSSGTPYGAEGNIDPRPFVGNPGYVTPPNPVTYFFTARDAFRTEDYWQTDVSLNYNFHLRGLGDRASLFFKGDVLNVFNDARLSDFNEVQCGTSGCINTAVLTNFNASRFAPFNPFTTQPIEGVNWAKGPDFGKPLSRFAYQTPRTYRFSVGFRF